MIVIACPCYVPPLISSLPKAHRWQLLGSAWLLTATGRVIGDAHWVSDTVAAGYLALAAASALSLCSKAINSSDFLILPSVSAAERAGASVRGVAVAASKLQQQHETLGGSRLSIGSWRLKQGQES